MIFAITVNRVAKKKQNYCIFKTKERITTGISQGKFKVIIMSWTSYKFE